MSSALRATAPKKSEPRNRRNGDGPSRRRRRVSDNRRHGDVVQACLDIVNEEFGKETGIYGLLYHRMTRRLYTSIMARVKDEVLGADKSRKETS